MRTRSVRLALKWSFPANLVLLACVFVDYTRNEAALTIPLLALYAALTLCVLLLFFAEARPKVGAPIDAHPFDGEPVRLAISQRP